MQKRLVGKTAHLLLLAAALASCRAMDTMISTTSAAYTLGAEVNGRDLEEYAVVDAKGAIRPVFASDSTKDPDAVALRIELRDQAGKAAVEAVEYRVEGTASRAASASDTTSIRIGSLSEELPAFSLPADLPVGRYSLSLQVLGEDGILYEKNRSFFYVAEEAFAFVSLLSYPPGSGPTSRAPVFPTKIPLLLEAAVEAGAGLDPYLVWSFGGKRFAAGRVSEGGARVLWTTPANAGFHRIDVVLYPVAPLGQEKAESPGLSRSLTIATSPSAPFPGLPGKNGDYSSIYRFLGDLQDSGSAGFAPLSPVAGLQPEWLPFSSGYGTSVGPRRVLRADRPAAPVVGGLPVPTRITLSAAPRAPGILYRAVFGGNGNDPGDLVLTLRATETGPSLTVRSGGIDTLVASKEATPFDGEARLYLIELAVPESTRPVARVGFRLDGIMVGEIETAALDLTSGEGYFELGGPDDPESEVFPDTVAAVVDELAAVPLHPLEDRSAAADALGSSEIGAGPPAE
jgi:hypothetical protein